MKNILKVIDRITDYLKLNRIREYITYGLPSEVYEGLVKLKYKRLSASLWYEGLIPYDKNVFHISMISVSVSVMIHVEINSLNCDEIDRILNMLFNSSHVISDDEVNKKCLEILRMSDEEFELYLKLS